MSFQAISPKFIFSRAPFTVLRRILASVLPVFLALSCACNSHAHSIRQENAYIAGAVARPLPALLSLEYNGSLFAAWLKALQNAAMQLPGETLRQVAGLGLDRETGNLAICSFLFPIDVATPELSAGPEIKVFLKTPDNLNSDLQGLAEKSMQLLIRAGLLENAKKLLRELGEAWPTRLEPGVVDFERLEKLDAQIGAMWNVIQNPQEENLENAIAVLPDNIFLTLLLSEAKLKEGEWQTSLELLGKAKEQAEKPEASAAVPFTLINSVILYLRGNAHLQAGQTGLADFDFGEALKGLANYPAVWDIEKNTLKARADMNRARRDFAKMCEDLEKVCGLGDCNEFLEVRLRGLCPGGQ